MLRCSDAQLSNSAACKHFHSLLRSLLLSLSSSVPCTLECKILNYDGSCFSIKGATKKGDRVKARSIKSLPLTATWTHSCLAWVSKCGTSKEMVFFERNSWGYTNNNLVNIVKIYFFFKCVIYFLKHAKKIIIWICLKECSININICLISKIVAYFQTPLFMVLHSS